MNFDDMPLIIVVKKALKCGKCLKKYVKAILLLKKSQKGCQNDRKDVPNPQMRIRYQFGPPKPTNEKTRRAAARALHPPLKDWRKRAPGRPFW